MENKKEWRKVKLKEVIEFNPKEILKKGTLAKYIEMANLQCFQKNILKYEIKEYKGGTKFRNGDTLLARITPCLENGKTGFIDFLSDDEVAFGSTEYIILREKKEITNKDFVYYLSISDEFRNLAIKSMSGTSGRQRVQLNALLEAEIFLPPLDIQKKIAKILSDIDSKIELNNKINDNLEKQLQILFKEMFEEEINNVNDNTSKSLKEFIEIIDNRGKTPPLSPVETNFPIIDVRSLAGNTRILDYNNCSKYVKDEIFNTWFRSGHPQKYDILISTVGSLAELKLFFEDKGCIAQNVVSFRSKNISALYLYQYLKYIKNDLVSYNIGSVQPSIKITHIINHQIFYSDFDKINKFHQISKNVTDKIFCNCKEIRFLYQMKNLLLPKLMNGEIDVENIEL